MDQETMEQETIVLKIKDNDPLCVSVKRLTADSRLFRYLICDLHFTELEMDDFRPDTVFIFLALLQDKTVKDIQEEHFRELHKMSVVFEVDWLMESCREWLVNKINDHVSSDVMEYEATLFLLEESRYILTKWELCKFVDLLISKLAAVNNTAFISQYMRDFDKLDPKQLDIMLKLGGSNTAVFLEIVLQNITGKQFLDTNTKYLLENMNLALCLVQNDQLYHQMFEALSAMSELTNTDLRFLLKLMATTSGSTAYSRKTGTTTTNTICDDKEWYDLVRGCNTLEDIILRVEDARINNMSVVLCLLLIVAYEYPLTAEEGEVFVDRLVNFCRDKPLMKGFSPFIDSTISTLMLSDRDEKVELIVLLEKIKNNNKLSSYHDYITIPIIADVERYRDSDGILSPVEFKHPGVPSECRMSGKCGFVIKKTYDKHNNLKVKLCKDKADYEGTELHYHDVVSAEDMHYLVKVSYTTQDGKKETLYKLGYRNIPWCVSAKRRYNYTYCIAYNISKHLVAKQD